MRRLQAVFGGARSNDRLDRLGAFVLGLSVLLLAWRTTLGGLNAYSTHSGTMMLGFPEWIVYAFMVPPMLLTAVIGFWQAIRGFGNEVAE